MGSGLEGTGSLTENKRHSAGEGNSLPSSKCLKANEITTNSRALPHQGSLLQLITQEGTFRARPLGLSRVLFWE